MTQTLFNPFLKIAGTKALLFGWLAILATAAVAYYSHTHFPGAIDVKVGAGGLWWLFLLEPLIAWLCVSIAMYVAGMIVARSSVRMIDIAGTMALARWPMFFVTLLAFIPVEAPAELSTNVGDYTSVLLLALVMLPFTVWMIVLMYQGYKVSTGVKGTEGVLSFIIALVAAEVSAFVVFLLLSRTIH